MAQTVQIVPKFSFPYVETVVNDYTLVADNAVEATADTSIKQAYAIVSPKGIDNKWVRKSTKSALVKTFGDSNFKKYGQPLMQAIHTVEQDNASVWVMRVMPENATYANAIVSAYYKADTAEDVAEAHKRKFRIKLTSTTAENVINTTEYKSAVAKEAKKTSVDADGYTPSQIMAVKYMGRGTCGNYYSLRMSQNAVYEKEYGIKMYTFDVITSESGIVKDAYYVGGLVTSSKYGSESTTLIDDILGEVEAGVAPLDITCNEDGITAVYDAYIAFLKELNEACIEEYETKLDEYDIPQEMLDGTVAVTEEYYDQYTELKEIEEMIDATTEENYPDIDEFDPIFGLTVGSTVQSLPAIYFPAKLTDAIDTTAEDYDPLNYTSTENLVDFSSVKGLILSNGTNGYFDEPRTVIDEGETVQYTLDDEILECYKNAYDGTADPKILSSRRIGITAFFDANYPYEIKQTIVDLAMARNDCRVFLDTGIIASLSTGNIKSLIDTYSVFDDHMISTDIHNYEVKEYSTNKKCNVTITYFLAAQYVYHLTNVGYHVPMVKAYAQLSGHVKDSLQPIIEEYNTDIKEKLYDNRLNYFECMSENVFQRAVQNTTQKTNTDLLEENNSAILFTLKRSIEEDIQGQIYNFADSSVRQTFIETEIAKYASLSGRILESFEISFSTSEYEFERSILHCYLAIVFRGLTKKCIVEIDINKRTYTSNETTEEDVSSDY